MLKIYLFLKSIFTFRRKYRYLTIYCAGAPPIKIRCTDWSVEVRGDELVGLKIAQPAYSETHLIVKSLRMSSIVAMVES